MADTNEKVTLRELHHRRIDMRGYERSDGLYELQARITDIKTETFKVSNGPKVITAGDPVHDMGIDLVFDRELVVQDVSGFVKQGPYDACYQGNENLHRLKGLRIGAGWSSEVRKRLGGADCCAHLRDMLMPMAPAAIQTTTVTRQSNPETFDAEGRPAKLNSCYAYGTEREVVMTQWPKFYTGK